MHFSGKSTGAGCHFLFKEIFPTQGSNLCLLHFLRWQADFFLTLCYLGSPVDYETTRQHLITHLSGG